MAKTVQSFVREYVNPDTGEVVTYESQKVFTQKVNSESFYMTFIEYLAPVFKLKSESAIKTLIWLCEHAEFNKGSVKLTAEDRKELQEDLGICQNQITNNLKKLKELHLISGQNGKFLINPQIFWRGDAQSRQTLLKDKELKVSFEIV